MITFSPEISREAIVLLASGALCVICTGLIYLLRTRTVIRAVESASLPRGDQEGQTREACSVIVYSQDDPENLERLLLSLLAQEYPGPYEIIVVNEGESPDIRDLVSMLRARNSNLYLTSTPDGVRNLSRKKLGVTLGVKAARYGVLVLTTTAVDIPSTQWLSAMTRSFKPGSPTGVVLGFATIDPAEDDRPGKRRRAFDFVAESARWLAPALAGSPFRGVEYNLAYRKELFLKNSGFARSLNLHYGDDDIFVSEIATGENTAVELSPESLVYLREGNSPRIFRERMVRRSFTESFIPRRPFFLASLTGWLQLAALALCMAAVVLALPNLAATVPALLLMLLMWSMDIVVWRAAMKALRSRSLCLTLPWLSMTYPLRKLAYLLRSRIGKQHNYTWN
ncbi:MAG: glycosyltransferase [Muribaculaceae bacterium]|nr:glycosyltransferase [Muribaculaceae bacterium]